MKNSNSLPRHGLEFAGTGPQAARRACCSLCAVDWNESEGSTRKVNDGRKKKKKERKKKTKKKEREEEEERRKNTVRENRQKNTSKMRLSFLPPSFLVLGFQWLTDQDERVALFVLIADQADAALLPRGAHVPAVGRFGRRRGVCHGSCQRNFCNKR